MQGNTTEIDERNLLRLDALLSHGYGLSPQLVMRSKGLSIEAKALYGYLSSFAGAGDTAFPSTSRILEELDISKNRFYKIRKASVSVSEKGKNGKIVVKDISVAVNDEVKICTLPKGKYLLTVESAPDGYDKPAKSTSFTVKGDGKKVSAFAFLAKHVDKTAKSGESEDNAEATPADGASQNQDASSDGQNQNNQAENSSADMNRGASAPSSGNGQPSSTSTPTTTKTIHHPAETIRIAICDTCGADITDDIEGHKKSTGHPWYHYDAKVVKEAWDETVTVN